jgi:FlaA1/EpsC-like NDP-sugar epimerase
MRYFLGDIRDASRLRRAFEGIDVVILAAALKQVPAAQENITNMNRNLEMIAKQRAFWKEQ